MLPDEAGTPTRRANAPVGSTKLAPKHSPSTNHQPSTTNHAFTLIELLIVVMLLTVLMLTAFPAFRGLERTTNRHRAIAEADALAQASLAYRRVYEQWPLEPKKGDDEYDEQSFVYIAADKDEVEGVHYSLAEVVKVLRGGESPQNPRRTCFLEIADNRLNDVGMPIDPWNQPYVLLMGKTREIGGEHQVMRHEGGIELNIQRKQPQATATIDVPEDVVAFSWGDPAIPDAQDRVIGSWSKR